MFAFLSSILFSSFVFASAQVQLTMGHSIYTDMRKSSSIRGYVVSGTILDVQEVRAGKDCHRGWAVVDGGYLCLEETQWFSSTIASSPSMFEWEVPFPSHPDSDIYRTVKWQPERSFETLMPRVHARIRSGYRGRLWSSAEAYERGERPNWRLKDERDYSFVDVIETKKGFVLQRPNGRVTPLEEWAVYPVSRFEGRNLSLDSIPTGFLAAWVVEKEDVFVYTHPFEDTSNLSTSHWEVSFQQSLNVRPYNDFYYIIEDVFGTGKHGYIEKEKIATWNEMPIPEGVRDDEIWIDIDIDEQVLALRQGEETLFVTLISSAKEEFETPTGLFRIYKKAYMWDLASKPDADEQYFIESVPWVMHYFPRYAIHTAFWHADFGIPSSHGCINMSPRDVQIIFDSVTPKLPEGWNRVERFSGEYGSLIRIREGSDTLVPNRIIRD